MYFSVFSVRSNGSVMKMCWLPSWTTAWRLQLKLVTSMAVKNANNLADIWAIHEKTKKYGINMLERTEKRQEIFIFIFIYLSCHMLLPWAVWCHTLYMRSFPYMVTQFLSTYHCSRHDILQTRYVCLAPNWAVNFSLFSPSCNTWLLRLLWLCSGVLLFDFALGV